jgi:hypothetical protein
MAIRSSAYFTSEGSERISITVLIGFYAKSYKGKSVSVHIMPD